MSLLLDALKKAAEQKAAKAREKKAESGPADETALETPGDDTGATLAMEDDSLPRHRLEDETELQTRVEDADYPPDDSTRAGVDARDDTQTELQTRIEQMQTGEDETIVFDERDITEFMEEVPRELEAQSPADEPTEIGRLESDDSTAFDETAFTESEFTAPRTEDTEIQISEHPDDTGITAGTVSAGDQTDISIPPAFEEDLAGRLPETSAEDTDLSRPASPPAEDTNLSQPVVPLDDDTGPKAIIPPSGDDDDITTDDDMSLMLVEREETSFTSPTSMTDPQRSEDQASALRGEGPAEVEMTLVDNTVQQTGSTTRPRSSDTATTGIAERTGTAEGALPRADATATHTYAPDNYDRTLMRLPNDDASRLFAGMKSDSDVVMTPDYAKRVFRSKSSAQRMQYYKIYGGIAIAILLGVGVYGVLEYQSEVERIDTSLRPLKRDPMPGIISPRSAEEDTALFAKEAIDERAVELIQNAEELVPDAGVIVESAEEPVTEQLADETSPATGSAEPDVEIAQGDPAASESTSAVGPGAGEEIAMIAPSQAEAEDSGTANPNLQIRPGSPVQRQQILLREAYQAYQAGKDSLALERYNAVLAIEPGNRSALLGRAAINVRNDNSIAAIADYRSLLLANPKDSLAMASLLAVASFSPRETETQLKLMIRDEPESPHLNFALANAYGAQNRWQEAQNHYFTALKHNPGDPNYAYNLAVSLEHISQPKAAISYYRRALENYNSGLATFSKEVVDRRLEILERQ